MSGVARSRDGIPLAFEVHGAGMPALVLVTGGHATEATGVASLRELSVPVVAINPDARPTDSESLRRHGVRTLLVSGVGHFLMLEDPDRFNRLLREVIEEFTG
jgi:pimeloyl-ACP methyl ester carboxylesterase